MITSPKYPEMKSTLEIILTKFNTKKAINANFLQVVLAIRVPLCFFQIDLNKNINHYHYATNGFRFYQLSKELCYKKIYPYQLEQYLMFIIC